MEPFAGLWRLRAKTEEIPSRQIIVDEPRPLLDGIHDREMLLPEARPPA